MAPIKHIVAPVASGIAMALLMFAPIASAQDDRTVVAYGRSGVTAGSAPDVKQRPDPVAESFSRMLGHTPSNKSESVAPRTDSDPLREAVVRALWSSADKALARQVREKGYVDTQG